MAQSSKWYKENDNGQIWWEKTDRICAPKFSFDKKKKYDMFTDYPHNMTPEEVEIFDKENPFWANFFRDRKTQ